MSDGRWKVRQRRRWRREYIAAAVGLGAAVLLAISFLVSVARLPAVSQTTNGEGEEEKASCPDYGCPLYPHDYASVQETLLQGLNSSVPVARQDFAFVTRQSNEHNFNQDKAVYIRPFYTKQSLGHEERSFLVAVFDGHGEDGHVVAENVAGMLPLILAQKLNERPCCQNDDWIRQQLTDAFVQVNQELPPFAALRGGCTATLSLRLGSKLCVANTGDSRTILVTTGSSNENVDKNRVEIRYQSRRDKAHLPDERARIEGLGGKIHIPPNHPDGSRVIVYSASAVPPEPIGLAMSRSIGDWEWKEVGVIAEPIVDILDLTQYHPHSFLLAASDGVWDMRQPEFFAKRFAERLSVDGPLKTVVDLVRDVSPAKKEWYRDDMTLVYVTMD